MRKWDVIVAGAGPAGSRAAELLAHQGVSVLLLDPKAPWEKPCGGGLTAAALVNTPELRELANQSEEVREILTVAPSGVSVVIPLRKPYRVISRLVLSEWGLKRAREAGVTFVAEAVSRLNRHSRGWQVTDSAGGVYEARWLVGADGAASRIRGTVAPGFKPELDPTRVTYPTGAAPPGRAVFQFLPAAEGYLWDFPRPGHRSLGIGVAPGTFQRDALDSALTGYQAAESGEPASPTVHRGAVIATSEWVSGSFRDLGGRDFALLGDAAGLADPATGEGIDYALRSATIAAGAFGSIRGFADYPEAIRRQVGREMRRAKLIRRWLYHPSVAEQLIRRARRSPRSALLLMALTDAINEHGSLSGALWRALRGPPADVAVAQAVCDCPDGAGASAPITAGDGGRTRVAALRPRP